MEMVNINVKSILDEMVNQYILDGEYTYDVYVDYRDEVYDMTAFEDEERFEVLVDDYILNTSHYVYSELDRIIKDIASKKDIDLDFEGYDLKGLVMESIFINYNIDEILKNTDIRVNILLNNKLEYDTVHTNNSKVLEYYLYNREVSNINECIENSSIKLLFDSQGYSLEDLKDSSKIEASVFLKSILDEIENISSDVNILTVLLGTDGYTFMDEFKKGMKIKLDTDVNIGFYDSYNGGGSLLGITLEKPFVVEIDSHTDFQIEGGSDRYSVDNVYGLCRSGWSNRFDIVG